MGTINNLGRHAINKRAHAHQLHNDYFRIPRAVCRLLVNDIPLAMGIAQMVRTGMVRRLKSGAAIEAPIGEWLEAAGVNAKEQVRKEGRKFWPAIADDLARVAGDGKLGALTSVGHEGDLVLTLTPDTGLRKSYAPLLEAANAQAKAKRTARVADQRQKPRQDHSWSFGTFGGEFGTFGGGLCS